MFKKLIVLAGNGVIVLPAPEWGDKRTLRTSMNLRRSMNGLTYTYIRTSDRKSLDFTFKLARKKSLELRHFIRNNYTSLMLMDIVYEGELWSVKFSELPIELNFEQSSRTENGRISVDLKFEGARV